MNRLQKKCFVASAGVHILLAVILFVGPGFLPSRAKPEDLPLLTFVPVKTVDDLISGGGNPKAQPAPLVPLPQPPQAQAQPAPAPPQPAPQPEPPKAQEPEPPKETKPVKQDDESADLVKQPRKIEISTKLVTRPKDSSSEKKAREEAEARKEARALADARRRLAQRIGRAAEQIGSELSGGTAIEMQGPGGGGPAYANFFAAVKSAYDRAWVLPDGVVNGDAVILASVTIRRDGKVVSHQIIRRSGDRAVDDSVQLTLERVTYAAPLPDTSATDTRTVSISFSVRAKKLLG